MALSRVKIWSNEVLTAADLNAEFNNIISNASSLISPLSGSLDWDGYAHTLDAAGVTTAQSSASIGWSFIPGSKTGTPSSTGGLSNWAASTWTDSNTAASGTATSWTGHSFQRPTLAASNATVTTTDAATVYIANSPLAGSNETLANTWSLWVDAGHVRFDDNVSWLSGTAFKGTFDHANSADRTYTYPDADGTIPTIATQAEVNTATSTTTGLTPNHNTLVLGTVAATTSGTSFNFASLPSGTRRVTLMLAGVSLSGGDDLLVQIGPSGGVETSTYVSTSSLFGSAPAISDASSTAGFIIVSSNNAFITSGQMTLTLLNSSTNQWVASFVGKHGTGTTVIGGGNKSLAGVLSQLTLKTTGVNSFDAGAVNIIYER